MLKELERFRDATSAFTVMDVVLVMLLSYVLGSIIAWIYRYTHRGASYAQSYAQTLVLMGIIVAVVMLVIGSNIARAFSLVGALSIVRFRNAVKETRDVGYMFFVMAIGMACGTRFYALAAFATAAISAVAVVMHRLDLFSKRTVERILRVFLPAELDPQETFEPVFRKHLDEARLISLETARAGSQQEVVYNVVLKPETTEQSLLSALREVNGNQKVILVVGQQEVDL